MKKIPKLFGSSLLILLFFLAFVPSGKSRAEDGPRMIVPPDSVWYAAEVIDYRLDENTVILLGNARVRYKEMELEAGKITYQPDKELVFAEGIPDTTDDGRKITGIPVFRDGEEQFTGVQMSYNLSTGRGTVIQGRTRYEEGFYSGSRIRKVEEETFMVKSATYTTCELKDPHYHFHSHRMKIIFNDKVIARPVIFYLRDVPLVWLPFFIFSIRKDRHSGFLIPRYGSNSIDGRYLYDLGYYLAPGDYWDATFRGRLREKTGWMIQISSRYHLRGRFRGHFDGSFEKRRIDSGNRRTGWELGVGHIQDIAGDMTLRASGRFRSDRDFSLRNSTNLYERLNRTLRSHLSLNKNWRGFGSLNLTLSHNKNLDTGETSMYLPKVSFRKPRTPVFRPLPGKSGARKWYHSIYYSLNSGFSNYRTQSRHTVNERVRLDGRLGVSGSQKLFGWLNLGPSLDLGSVWTKDRGKDPFRTDSYGVTLSANTTLYGLFRPEIGSLRAARHVLSPRIIYTFRFQSQQDGWSSQPRNRTSSQRLGLSVGNIFQIKTRRRKFDLATLDLSTGYDLKLHRFSDLNTTLRIRPGKVVNLTLYSSHNFYDSDGKLRLLSPDLKSLSVVTSLRLSGEGPKMAERAEKKIPEGFEETAGYVTGRVEYPQQSSYGTRIRGWSLGLSHRYSLTRIGLSSSEINWIKGNLSFDLTRKWHFDYWFNYDLTGRKMTSQQIGLYRDLHCWEARAVWALSGYRRGYYIRLNIKALPEIKIEKRKGVIGL